ncbi:MAG TPA: HIT domain-containing protein [Vicinamibacterales bacterium]|nr:HIT domain-containing protein [Vicinamibacterales bacterium]
MVDHLWSPWRLEYVKAHKPDTECVFCRAISASAEAADALGAGAVDPLVVFQGNTAYVILNRYPYNNGHLMVVPRRHVATLIDLTPDELHEIALLTQRSEAVLREAYDPGGINVGLNLGKPAGGGIHFHLHVHLVPRWVGDANFMSIVGETRVLVEELHTTAERLRPIFERLAT